MNRAENWIIESVKFPGSAGGLSKFDWVCFHGLLIIVDLETYPGYLLLLLGWNIYRGGGCRQIRRRQAHQKPGLRCLRVEMDQDRRNILCEIGHTRFVDGV